jgi:hypothetical protein
MFSIHRPLSALAKSIAAAASLIGGAALAQSVTLPRYQSALSDYQAHRDERPANWRDLNDTMGMLGGHAAHLRDIESKVSGASKVAPVPEARTPADPHASHNVTPVPVPVPQASKPHSSSPGHDMKTMRGMQ